MPNNESAGSTQLLFPDLRHVLKLERNVLGQPQLHTLPLTKGYYNGCLLTITSGPAAGQSARIVDYEFIADIPIRRQQLRSRSDSACSASA